MTVSKKKDCDHPVTHRSTREVLGSGGDYETVPVVVCSVCRQILGYVRCPDYCEDGEAD